MAHPLSDAFEDAESAPGRVLLVDDQPELRRLFRRNLNKIGHVVVEAWNGRVALDLVQQLSFDVVISDVHMPDLSGIDLLQALSELEPDLPVVLTSGSPGGVATLEAGDLGVFAYLVKPVSFDTMRDTVAKAIDMRRARAAAKELFEPYCSVERLRVPRPEGEDDER